MMGAKAWIRGGLWVTAGVTVGFGAALGVGASPVWALGLNTPEALEYSVAYGFIPAGTARLTYTPPTKAGQPYGLDIAVRDNTILIELNNRYSITGAHSPAPFTSHSYHAVQKENDYRADKVVAFDATRKQVVYTNRRDAADKVAPLLWDGRSREVFSQLYAMRMEGLEALKTPRRIPVMGLKRTFTLVQGAATRVEGSKTLWRVPLRAEEKGKTSRDTWAITVRPEADGTLTPVKIVAQTRFGSFTATLKSFF